jgi:hypothetical protein
MQSYQQNLNRAVDADELLDKVSGLAVSPGTLFACGAYVLEAITGRDVGNILVACKVDTRDIAERLGRITGLTFVPLKDSKDVYHLAAGGRDERTITLVPLSRPGIRGNLEDSGFTVEAMAVDLAERSPRKIIDPFGGVADLERGRLRAVTSRSFHDDPARLLLAAELADKYGLELETGTEASMVAAARQVEELEPDRSWRLVSRLFGGRSLNEKARFLKRTGVLAAVLPEVEAIYDVPQNYYHHLGVWEHTLDVLDRLEGMLDEPARFFPAFAGRIGMNFKRELAGGVDRRAYIGFAALIHDIGKPASMTVEPSGRIRFQGHQEIGGRMAGGIAGRMGLPRKGGRHLVGVVAEHMRLGFLLKEGESAESRLRVVRELGDRCIEVVMLSLADRLATCGEASTEEAMGLYKRMASRVMHDYFWDIDNPPLVSGHDVMMHMGLGPGPEVARALLRARVAQREAIVSGRQQALEYMAPDFKGKMNMRGRAGDGR